MNWKKKLESAILNKTLYSGSTKKEKKVISASSLGQEDLFNLMQYKHGKKVNNSFGASEIGSVYQLGIDEILKDNPDYIVGLRMEHELPNGWKVSGEFDLFDKVNNVIVDCKVLSPAGHAKAIKGNEDDSYNLQLATYRYLIEKTKPKGIDLTREIYTGLHAVNKGGSASKGNILWQGNIPTNSLETIEKMLLDKSNTLQDCIDNDKLPDQLCDQWKFGRHKGGPARCAIYCDYKDVCPMYSKETEFQIKKNDINTIMKLEPTGPLYKPGKKFDF